MSTKPSWVIPNRPSSHGSDLVDSPGQQDLQGLPSQGTHEAASPMIMMSQHPTSSSPHPQALYASQRLSPSGSHQTLKMDESLPPAGYLTGGTAVPFTVPPPSSPRISLGMQNESEWPATERDSKSMEKRSSVSVSDWDEYRRNRTLPPPPKQQEEHSDLEKKSARGSKPRKYCCCFTSKKSCCIGVCLITFVTLLVLGIVLFFCWPRMPTVTVLPIYPEAGNGLGFNQTGDPVQALKSASPSTPFGAYSVVIVPVSVYSPNYINFFLESVDAQMTVTDRRGNTIPGIQGVGSAKDITITSQSNTTIPFVRRPFHSFMHPTLLI